MRQHHLGLIGAAVAMAAMASPDPVKAEPAEPRSLREAKAQAANRRRASGDPETTVSRQRRRRLERKGW